MRELRRLRAVVVVAVVVVLGACSFDGLSFRQDRRLSFTSPHDREEVTLPVTVEWEIDDFEIVDPGDQAQATPGQGYFAVLVDQTPQPPGEPLKWFAGDDDSCKRDPGCPDEQYLANRGVHTTTDTSFTIDALSQPSNENRREMHEVTVVLLNAEGVRIGESSWTVEFEVDRQQDI